MKTKSIIIGALAVAGIAGGGYQLHQTIQHARLDLVTLNVSAAPLAEVLARVARQTRETIVADQTLGGTVTLNVRGAPLRQVLGQIADQVGAFSRLNFAVGSSGTALHQLQFTLRQGRPLPESGWTNLSAVALNEEPADREALRRGSERAERAGMPATKDEPRGGVRMLVTRDAPDDPKTHRGGAGSSGSTHVRLLTTGTDGTSRTIDLSPERLLVESTLAESVATTDALRATAAQAAELALAKAGRWQPIYVLEALPMPMGGLPPELNRFGWTTADDRPGPGGPPPGDPEATLRRHRYDQLTRLTPEQRARNAARQPGPGMRLEVDVEDR